MAWPISTKNMTCHGKATAVFEVCVMPLTVKEMYFISGRCGIEHSVFSEMIGRAIPVKCVARKVVGVLLCRSLLSLCDEQNYFVVFTRRYYAASNGVKAGITP